MMAAGLADCCTMCNFCINTVASSLTRWGRFPVACSWIMTASTMSSLMFSRSIFLLVFLLFMRTLCLRKWVEDEDEDVVLRSGEGGGVCSIRPGASKLGAELLPTWDERLAFLLAGLMFDSESRFECAGDTSVMVVEDCILELFCDREK